MKVHKETNRGASRVGQQRHTRRHRKKVRFGVERRRQPTKRKKERVWS